MDVAEITLDFGFERVVIERCDITYVDDGTLRFDPPIPLALGSASVIAENQIGPSNAVTLQYVASNPLLLAVQSCVLVTGDIDWTMAAGAGASAQLLLSLDDVTIGSGGLNVLANGTAIFSGTLDAVGVASWSRNADPAYAGQTLYSQLVINDGAGDAIAASDVESTWVSTGGCGI